MKLVCLQTKCFLTGSEATGDSGGSDVAGELQDGPLAVLPRADHEHVSGVLDGGDRAGGQHHLLPGLGQVDNVNTILATLENVLLHGHLGVGGPNVSRSGHHLGDVAFLKNKKSLNRCFGAKNLQISAKLSLIAD